MPSTCDVDFNGQQFVLDAELALYWPAHKLLVVSDLHLEKATFLAQFGSAVAPYDTFDTLQRLETLVEKYNPQSLILLGDSFHDARAWQRLASDTRTRFLSLCASVDTCHLIEGNHDVSLMTGETLRFSDDIEIGGVAFRHEPKDSELPQVIGHFHPKLKTSLHRHRIVGKCFAMNERLLIMPAFGSFTGGLDIGDEAFAPLAGNDPFRTFVVYRNTIAHVDVKKG